MADAIQLWDDGTGWKWLLDGDAVAVDPRCCCTGCCPALADKTLTATISPSYECPLDADGPDVVIPLTYDATDNCWRGTGTGPSCWTPDDVTVEVVCTSLLWDKTFPAPEYTEVGGEYIWVRIKSDTDASDWFPRAVTSSGCIDDCWNGGLFTGLSSGTPVINVTTPTNCCPSSPGQFGFVCIEAV